MSDLLFIDSNGLSVLTDYVGSYFAAGLGAGMAFHALGMVLEFAVSLLRKGGVR